MNLPKGIGINLSLFKALGDMCKELDKGSIFKEEEKENG